MLQITPRVPNSAPPHFRHLYLGVKVAERIMMGSPPKKLSIAGMGKRRDRAVKRRLRTSNQEKGKSGWMDKLRKTKNALGIKMWDKRWIAIEKDTIRWYKHPDDKRCSGFINCYEIESVERIEPQQIKIVASYRDLVLRTSNSDEARRWLAVLRNMLKIWTDREAASGSKDAYEKWRAKTKAEHAARYKKRSSVSRKGSSEVSSSAKIERRESADGDENEAQPEDGKLPFKRVQESMMVPSPIKASAAIRAVAETAVATKLDLDALADDSDSDDEEFRRSLASFRSSRTSVKDLMDSKPTASRSRRFGEKASNFRPVAKKSEERPLRQSASRPSKSLGKAETLLDTSLRIEDFDSSSDEENVRMPDHALHSLRSASNFDSEGFLADDQTPSMQIASTIITGNCSATRHSSCDPDWLTADWD